MIGTDYVPHYRRIERALRERIGHLQPGDRLPSDTELCSEYGVSRMTARNAMQRLAEEGLVARQPGRGSFVARAPARRRAGRLVAFSHEMTRRGRVPSSRLLAREVRPADANEASELEVDPGDPVVVVQRLRALP